MIFIRRLRNEKGQALVEFAIILPVLLLIVMGIIQFAMMLNAYLSLQNAAREGARAGIVGSSDIEIRQLIVDTSPSLEEENLTISVEPAESSRVSGDTLTVKLTYNYKLTIPIISGILGDTTVLKAENSMRIE